MKDSILVWEKRRINGKSMPKDELKAEIDAFISKRSNCALATGYGTYIRNTPMRYSYKDGKLFFITEGGNKFRGLSANSHVCIAIYDSDNTTSETAGVTIEGTATITVMEKENISLKEPQRFMIVVSPTIIDYLDYSLIKRGYYQLQRLSFIDESATEAGLV